MIIQVLERQNFAEGNITNDTRILFSYDYDSRLFTIYLKADIEDGDHKENNYSSECRVTLPRERIEWFIEGITKIMKTIK